MKRIALIFIAAGFVISSTRAVVWEFDIEGRATSGLSAGNEIGAPASPATGGELSPGIRYDDATHELTLHFGWGSAPGVGGTDLQGDLDSILLQGPASVNGTAGQVLYFLHTSAGYQATDAGGLGRSGLFDMPYPPGGVPALALTDNPNGNTYSISDQEQDLLASHWYIQITSSTFPGGEIRGQLTAVPEPRDYALASGLGLLALAGHRICSRLRKRIDEGGK